ncbi:L,D-transpeptidase, partial [Micromonospora provocatoris]
MKRSLFIIAVLVPASLLSACSYHTEEHASLNTKKTDEHMTAARKPEKTSIDLD